MARIRYLRNKASTQATEPRNPLDPSSFRNASIRHLDEIEREIDILLPSEKLRGKADPVLQEALAKYANVVWNAAKHLPLQEETNALIPSAQALTPHPVFVVGVHRSGTTLMHHLLDGHPALAVLPAEGTYLTNFYPRLRRMDKDAGIAHLVQHWIPRLINPNNQPPYWTLGRTQRDHTPYLTVARNVLYLADHACSFFDTYAPFQLHLAVVMACYGVQHGHQINASKKYWVDKTPLNEFHVARLYAAFPEAKIIHVVRDPRAIFASRKKLDQAVFGTAGRPLRLLYKVRRSLHLARHNQEHFGRATYHVVRYEDLINDLLGEMASVRTFLGIADHEALVTPTSSGVPCAANSSYSLPFAMGRVQAYSATYYEEILTPIEHQLVESFTGRHAQKMGYSIKSGGVASTVIAITRYGLSGPLR